MNNLTGIPRNWPVDLTTDFSAFTYLIVYAYYQGAGQQDLHIASHSGFRTIYRAYDDDKVTFKLFGSTPTEFELITSRDNFRGITELMDLLNSTPEIWDREEDKLTLPQFPEPPSHVLSEIFLRCGTPYILAKDTNRKHVLINLTSGMRWGDGATPIPDPQRNNIGHKYTFENYVKIFSPDAIHAPLIKTAIEQTANFLVSQPEPVIPRPEQVEREIGFWEEVARERREDRIREQ